MHVHVNLATPRSNREVSGSRCDTSNVWPGRDVAESLRAPPCVADTHQAGTGRGELIQLDTYPFLDYYLDEFTFRFNRRKSHSRGKLFFHLCQQAVQVGPVPAASLPTPNL